MLKILVNLEKHLNEVIFYSIRKLKNRKGMQRTQKKTWIFQKIFCKIMIRTKLNVFTWCEPNLISPEGGRMGWAEVPVTLRFATVIRSACQPWCELRPVSPLCFVLLWAREGWNQWVVTRSENSAETNPNLVEHKCISNSN